MATKSTATHRPETPEQERVIGGSADVPDRPADAGVPAEIAPKPKRTRGAKSDIPAPSPDASKATGSVKAKESKGIGVKELAESLGTNARALRAFLRRSKRAVGRGTRYEWQSLSDPEAKQIAADWKAAQEPATSEAPSQ